MGNSISKISPEPADFVRQSRRILKNIVSTKDFETGFEFIEKVEEMGEAFTRAKSIVLSGMDEIWKPQEHDGETFLQKTVRRLGLSPETIIRHTRNEKLSGKIPGEFREAIDLAPENCRLPIANLLEDGYEIEHKDWQALSEVSRDRRRVSQIIRKIRKVEPRSNWSMFTIDEDGVITKHSKEKHEQVGVFDVFSDSQFVLDGIESIKRRADIKPSVEY